MPEGGLGSTGTRRPAAIRLQSRRICVVVGRAIYRRLTRQAAQFPIAWAPSHLERGARKSNAEGAAILGSRELRAEPRGDGVGRGGGSGTGVVGTAPAAADEGEVEGAVPAEHHAPGDGAAIGAADAEGVEVVEDGALADEDAVEVGKMVAELGIGVCEALGDVVSGQFAVEAAPASHGGLVADGARHTRLASYVYMGE